MQIMETEKYHQIIPEDIKESLKRKIGNFLFGVYDIEVVEYIPEPKSQLQFPFGSEGEYL